MTRKECLGAVVRPVALVTGGARRIGAAIARELARAGFRVVVTCLRSGPEARALAREVGGAACRLDLSRPASFGPFAARFARRFRRLDLLVHNAALFPRTPFGEVRAADWDAVFAVNARAPLLLTQALRPLMSDTPGASAVVFLGDAGASALWPSYLPYCLSKLAVEAEARALEKALAPGIRVGLVRPGLALRADDFPEDRWRALRARPGGSPLDSPEKVARAVATFVKPVPPDSHILRD